MKNKLIIIMIFGILAGIGLGLYSNWSGAEEEVTGQQIEEYLIIHMGLARADKENCDKIYVRQETIGISLVCEADLEEPQIHRQYRLIKDYEKNYLNEEFITIPSGIICEFERAAFCSRLEPCIIGGFSERLWCKNLPIPFTPELIKEYFEAVL